MDFSKKEKAINAIKSSSGTDVGEYGIDSFINHHLKELHESDWNESIGIKKPTKVDVLKSMILKSCWDEGLAYDFSLPNDVTDYVVSVRFDENGEIEDISMES